MKEVRIEMSFEELEKEYIEKINNWRIEEDILYSFSKEELNKLIEATYESYMKIKMPYEYILSRKKFRAGYEDLNQLSKYLIEQYSYYFNWGEEIELTHKFLERLRSFYKSNYEQSNRKKYKKFDIHSVNIADVLGQYMKLPKNLNRNCPCPLHKEKTGSFRIYKNTNTFYCFWCHKWWNIVNFVSEIERISTKEAYIKLAKLFSNY